MMPPEAGDGLMSKSPKCLAEKPQLRRLMTVYAGRECIGSIEEGKTCLARNAAGDLLGTFENRKAAMRAVQNTARAS
jgi:hypothetical protein